MTAPLPTRRLIAQPPPPAATPAVRLTVRVGAGRPTERVMAGDAFVVGGGSGCDLVLAGADLPPVICRFTRAPAGVTVRKAESSFPVLLNGSPVAGLAPIPLKDGDRVTVGPVDVTVGVGSLPLRPMFVPISEPPPAVPSTEVAPEPLQPSPAAAELAAEADRLEQLRDQLDEQARELEADRVLWYRRRQEIEAECERRLAEAVPPPAAPAVDLNELAEREAELARRADVLTAKEQELAKVRDDLTGVQLNLSHQYQQRREQLDQMQDVVHGAAAALQERQQQFEAEATQRRAVLTDAERAIEERVRAAVVERTRELDAEYDRRAQQLAAEWDARRPDLEREVAERAAVVDRREEQLRQDRNQHAADLARLDRQHAALADRQRDIDRQAAEVDARHEQLARDTAELEETVHLAGAEQDRLAAEAARLADRRADLETHAARLAARSSQLEAQQAMLAVLRARLDRQEEDARTEAARLAADRARADAARHDLDDRLREAERLRAELATEREGQAEQQQGITERSALLEATLAELRQQQAALVDGEARLADREAALDARSAELAEQTAVLTARAAQVMELSERLEADRTAVRGREAALADADTTRQTFQEQLRRRSEDLTARSRQLDETARKLADEAADLDRDRAALRTQQENARLSVAADRAGLTATAAELDQRTRALADREANLERQIARLGETGRAVAAARKDLAIARAGLDADRAQVDAARQDVEAFRLRAVEEMRVLRREAPELEDRARAAVDRLTLARDVLRGQLGELHAFAGQSRDELDAVRADLRAESDRLTEREQAVEKARAEHRLAVAEFRQQLLDWQSRVAELKDAVARSESTIDARRAEATEAARHADEAAADLARQAEELRAERERVAERRTEVERHLADMREWYRRKLRELATPAAGHGKTDRPPAGHRLGADDVDPGDKQLGELLQSLGLVDADTLAGLWAEAGRQRRTLRHVLLASGAVTLYQLALIEAGNLDGLMLGRFRVVDRLRATPRETVYRVFDPAAADDPGRGAWVLRHLSEADGDDAVRPDEFRQRFAAARDATHPNLLNTVAVVDVHGRPAAVQEWVTGLSSADWPPDAAAPGVWVRLLAAAAAGLDAAHRAGLAHGRLVPESFVLTADGTLKVLGFGEPPWLTGNSPAAAEPTPEADLHALGRVAYGWSQAGQPPGRRRSRGRAFPESLTAVVRRLEADPETPMADTVAGAVPYRSAADLVADLARLAALFPCPEDGWGQFVRYAADHETADPRPLRQSA